MKLEVKKCRLLNNVHQLRKTYNELWRENFKLSVDKVLLP